MTILFIEYPKCGTCKKARKWLDDHQIVYDSRHIVENNPNAAELKKWHELSGYPIKRFFNTSGRLYREMQLKDKIPNMTEEEIYTLLSTDGMLVKRPVIVTDQFVLTGFKIPEWENKLLKQ
jgi:arsenate reductase